MVEQMDEKSLKVEELEVRLQAHMQRVNIVCNYISFIYKVIMHLATGKCRHDGFALWYGLHQMSEGLIEAGVT